VFLHMFTRPPTPPLFPYTTLFRSQCGCYQGAAKYDFDLAKAKALMTEAGYANGFDTELYAFRERKWVDALAGYMRAIGVRAKIRSEEHTSELQSLTNLVCRLLLAK